MKDKIINFISKLKVKKSGQGIAFSDMIQQERYAFSTFTLKEKVGLTGLILIGTIFILGSIWTFNQKIMTTIAAPGGELSEGVIGSPRFINPLLAISDTDRDLTNLVYSGLMKLGPSGELIPDLAESYEISDDGLTYTFILKKNLTWHDGKKLTARDVVFTIEKNKNESAKSARLASWQGVRVEQSGDRKIIFTLANPYAPFLENTTTGILPTHLWTEVADESFSFSDLNINPVGSGPYKVTEIKRDSSGIPIYYKLEPFENYSLGTPKISTLRIRFYPNENELISAFNKGEVGAVHAITPDKISQLNTSDSQILSEELPRTFGLFFNQNQATVFTSKPVRQALDIAVDRERIVDEVLSGYGTPIKTPIIKRAEDSSADIEKAKSILLDAGWKEEDGKLVKGSTHLAFSISTADTPELKAIAEILKENWKAIGADVELKVFETGNLNQTVIRPRKYDVLLFGTVVGRYPDPYAFWHSSQRLDPGLNIALYANITTDRILEDLRKTTDKEIRKEKIEDFLTEIEKDIPAIFLYAPKLVYIVPKEIKNIKIESIADSSERFSSVDEWYIKTDQVWNIFSKNQTVVSN